ncbi:MAG: hypothetical protein KC731_27665, partial [Myxococcales bacterium]|nr:hypothetical protein [Myxococcales bacterium]
LDFGIAKLSGATGDLVNVKATATGDIFGTPMFMSPEQCLSQAEKISAQSDIWALGLIAYRLLTGSDFWTANTLTHLIAQIAYEPIPKPSEQPGIDLGPSFDTWFATCCNREVEARFASATEAVAALQTALGVGPDTSQALPPLAGLAVPPRASKPAGSKPSSGSHTDLVTGDTSLDASSPDVSSPDVSSPDRGALLKTSEALTLDSIDRSAVRPRSRRGLLAFAAVAVVGVALV